IVEHTGLGPAEQKVVEFAAADGVADDGRIRRFDGGLADHARPETSDLLEDETGRTVRARLEIEGAKHAWCHPSTAHLVARQAGAIEDDDIPSREAKRTRTGRAGRTTTYDQRITALHYSWGRLAGAGSQGAARRSRLAGPGSSGRF